jgi:hypothetical protein
MRPIFLLEEDRIKTVLEPHPIPHDVHRRRAEPAPVLKAEPLGLRGDL